MADLVGLVASRIPPASDDAGGGEPRTARGQGSRLAAAFEALEEFPVLAESRDRLLRVVPGQPVTVACAVAAVESDLALVVSVLRLANNSAARRGLSVESVVGAVDALSPEAVSELARRARTFDFFERTAVWDGAPERVRLHGLATRAAADRLAGVIGYEPRGRLMVTAFLHDIGKLVLTHAYAEYPLHPPADAGTPEERVRRERRELGIDHALVGGMLARRWGLPQGIASAIGRHHADDATGEAALVRLADMLAHYALDGAVSPGEMLKVAGALGIGSRELRRVMFDLPNDAATRPRPTAPCPLTPRETRLLRCLAEGKVYKQIAGELQVSVSTVRTHLHNVYVKLGSADRAQAVLTATARGWI
ncbi:MAG: hypothetical protein QOF77_1237 [Solirubrobacteraceae bacterium]|nr:hypothetical protein [Solirubrobacteraceae bacterium]